MTRLLLLFVLNFLVTRASSCKSRLVATLEPMPEIRQKVTDEVSHLSEQHCLSFEHLAANPHQRQLIANLVAEYSFWKRVGLTTLSQSARLTGLLDAMITLELLDAFGMLPTSVNYILLLRDSEKIPFYTTMTGYIARRQPQGSINNSVINEAVMKAIDTHWSTLPADQRQATACRVYGTTPEECPSVGEFNGTWYDVYDLIMYGESYSGRWQNAFHDFLTIFMDDPSKADAQDPTTMPNIPVDVLIEWTRYLQLKENVYAKKAFGTILNFFNPWYFMALYYSPFKTMGPFVVRLLIARDGLNEYTPELYFSNLNHMLLAFLAARDRYKEANKEDPRYEPSLGDCLLLVPDDREAFLNIVLEKRGVPALVVPKTIIRYRKLRMLIEEDQGAKKSQDVKTTSNKLRFNSKGERALFTEPFNDGEEAGFFAMEEETVATEDFHHYMKPSRVRRHFRPPYVDRDPDDDKPTPPTSSSTSRSASTLNTKYTQVADKFSEVPIPKSDLPKIDIPGGNLGNLSKDKTNVTSEDAHSSGNTTTITLIIIGCSVVLVICVLGLLWVFKYKSH